MTIKLSDTQSAILQAAMNRPTQDIATDSKVRPQGFAAAVGGLVAKGLVNRVKPKTDIDGSYVQKSEGGSFSFVLNTNAYVALGAEPDATVSVPKPAKGVAKIKPEVAEGEEDESEDDDDNVAKSGMMKKQYHDRYMAQGGGCGDNVDVEMRAAFTDEVEEEYQTKKGETRKRTVTRVNVAKLREWGEEIGLWNEAWENGNPGSQRMNASNRVRGAIRNGATIRLGKVVLTTPMPEPKPEKKPRAKKAK